MSETKNCPFCAEEILFAAIKCKHCGSMVGENPIPVSHTPVNLPSEAPQINPALPKPITPPFQDETSMTVYNLYLVKTAGHQAYFEFCKSISPMAQISLEQVKDYLGAKKSLLCFPDRKSAAAAFNKLSRPGVELRITPKTVKGGEYFDMFPPIIKPEETLVFGKVRLLSGSLIIMDMGMSLLAEFLYRGSHRVIMEITEPSKYLRASLIPLFFIMAGWEFVDKRKQKEGVSVIAKKLFTGEYEDLSKTIMTIILNIIICCFGVLFPYWIWTRWNADMLWDISIILGVLAVECSAVWVYRDMKVHGMERAARNYPIIGKDLAWKWAVGVLFVWIPILPLYIVKRKEFLSNKRFIEA